MPVDLTQSDASLLRQRFRQNNVYSSLLDLVKKENDYGLIRAVGYMYHFGVDVKGASSTNPSASLSGDTYNWTLTRSQFFLFFDIVMLLIAGTKDVTKDDFRIFRPILGSTIEGVKEILIIEAMYGINDDNSFIDNYYNSMSFTDDGIIKLVRIIADQLERAYENIGIGYRNYQESSSFSVEIRI